MSMKPPLSVIWVFLSVAISASLERELGRPDDTGLDKRSTALSGSRLWTGPGWRALRPNSEGECEKRPSGPCRLRAAVEDFPVAMAGTMTEVSQLQARVRAALDEERSLLDVERELLDRADLDAERRDALWLYAWSYRDRPGGRRRRPDPVDRPLTVRRR